MQDRTRTSKLRYGLREKLGAVAYDLPRFEWWLHRDWTRIRNRTETLEVAPGSAGMRCGWQWASDLHIAKVLPSTGRRLLRRALRDLPIAFATAPANTEESVQVSFVIGHRGTARLPHLLATLRTIAAQKGASCECIVVEQADEPEIKASLPSWVRYVHTAPPQREMPYCRSWTLNVGARLAHGALLVFHDNDMLVPDCYAAKLWQRYREGFEIINLKRFIFYLEEMDTKRFFESSVLALNASSESVVQNLEAGGSVAMAREAFFSIGGYDESFVGWGGEDNEFWERAQTRRVWSYTELPVVHLWHAAQPEKARHNPITANRFRELSSIPAPKRILNLVQRKFGDPQRMDPDWPPELTKA